MVERVSLEECTVVCTPFGLGVAVGDLVWTMFGPGRFPMDAREHQTQLDRLADEHPGEILMMAPFTLLALEQTWTVLQKPVGDTT